MRFSAYLALSPLFLLVFSSTACSQSQDLDRTRAAELIEKSEQFPDRYTEMQTFNSGSYNCQEGIQRYPLAVFAVRDSLVVGTDSTIRGEQVCIWSPTEKLRRAVSDGSLDYVEKADPRWLPRITFVLARSENVKVTGIAKPNGSTTEATVNFTYHRRFTAAGRADGARYEDFEGIASFVLYDDGWRVTRMRTASRGRLANWR